LHKILVQLISLAIPSFTSRQFLSKTMVTQGLPKLKVLLENGYLDIEDALKHEHDFVLETLINAFLLLPLSPDTLTRLQLGDCFRRSLQSSRQTTPYRLHSIVTECKAGTVDKASLEAQFFEHGGVRTVIALAAAAADNKQIVSLLKGLSNAEFQAFLKSIDAIKPHRDLLFIIETIERKRPSRLSKRKHVPGPRLARRPRRATLLPVPKGGGGLMSFVRAAVRVGAPCKTDIIASHDLYFCIGPSCAWQGVSA
jgi:hypothetical protein